MAGNTSRQKIITLEKRLEMFELRKKGFSHREIAARVGCSVGTVHNSVSNYLKESRQRLSHLVEDVLEMELRRLDELQAAYWDAAISGDEKAFDRVLTVMTRRSKYLGLDAPEQIDLRAVRAADDAIDLSRYSTQVLEASLDESDTKSDKS